MASVSVHISHWKGSRRAVSTPDKGEEGRLQMRQLREKRKGRRSRKAVSALVTGEDELRRQAESAPVKGEEGEGGRSCFHI